MSVNRLLEYFKPTHYTVAFHLNKTKLCFEGETTLKGSLLQPESFIRLHAKDLVIEQAFINDQPVLWRTDSDDELVLLSDKKLPIGDYSIKLTYHAKITDSMHGIYPCYFEHQNTKDFLLATQFESHHAREAFPCIDEPSAKATFDISVITDADLIVLGNMPIIKQISLENNETQTIFETSPIMSSYLVAFVTGDMHKMEAYSKSGILVRTWATPAQSPQSLTFALDIAVRTIDFFEEYFDTPYPLPKSDHVAVPDFSAGAMENWGLITYRESVMLMDEQNSSIDSKEMIALVVAHELSHQWFGNLVTMAWWDDLWLNESFANMMEYVAVNHLFPDWQVWLSFASQETVMAMRRDSLPGVQSIKVPVHHPDEISTLFDGAIVYAKGGNILKMLMHYIGEEAFRNGLKSYFKRHAYTNTIGDDLWDAFEKSSGKDIKAFMEPWLATSGFPVVTIDQQDSSVLLSQHQLIAKDARDESRIWPIPLGASPKTNPEIMDGPNLEVQSSEYLLLNDNASSFYVAHYVQPAHRNYIAGRIEAQLVSPVDRLRLLNESTMLARNGEMHLSETLELAAHYTNESRDAVWNIIAQVVGDARKLLEENEADLDRLKLFVQKIIEKQYSRLGWIEKIHEQDEDKKLRALILGLAVWSEHEDAKDRALELFTNFKKPQDIPLEIRGLVYSTGAKWQGMQAHQKLFTLYNTTTFADEKDTVMSGMTNARDSEVISLMLSYITTKDIVRSQDVQHWFVYLLRNPYAREQTWQWMTTHWQWIEQTFGGDKSYDDFPRYAGSSLIGESWLTKYENFFGPLKNNPALARNITLGIEEIGMRTAWQNRDIQALNNYLAQ